MYVHDIYNKYATENKIDDTVNHLQLISLQLLSTRINFTVHGFFPLNWSLLSTVIHNLYLFPAACGRKNFDFR